MKQSRAHVRRQTQRNIDLPEDYGGRHVPAVPNRPQDCVLLKWGILKR